jgi:hypothetical protein
MISPTVILPKGQMIFLVADNETIINNVYTDKSIEFKTSEVTFKNTTGLTQFKNKCIYYFPSPQQYQTYMVSGYYWYI